jgi:hypothetical protein
VERAVRGARSEELREVAEAVKTLAEFVRTGFEEMLERIDRVEVRLEEHSKRLEELSTRVERLERTVAVVAHRFGVLSEEGFREAVRYVVEEIFGVTRQDHHGGHRLPSYHYRRAR